MATTSPFFFLLDVAAAVALLLWAVRMVRTGMERAFSNALRAWFKGAGRWRVLAAGTGMGAAILLQSSTAVALLAASFLQGGAMAPAVGMAMLLGADLGSAIVVQLLVLRPHWFLPLLILVGAFLFFKGPTDRKRQIGRVLLGLGLVFVSLEMLSDATQTLPLSSMGTALAYLGRDAVGAFFVGAVLAWMMHSSVAAILLFATLAATGVLPVMGALAMALGANLGGALVAVGLTVSAPIEVRRVVLANLLARGGGAMAALWALSSGFLPLAAFVPSPAGQVVLLHLAFNTVLLLAMLPFTGWLVHATRLFLTDPPPEDADALSALDTDALSDPPRALACARREVLRMGEEVEAMLRGALPLHKAWDENLVASIARRESRVDGMHYRLKLYLSHFVNGQDVHALEARALASFVAQLESAGDQISSNLVAVAKRLHDEGIAFSPEGWAEIQSFHAQVVANAQLALDVVMTQDVDKATRLFAAKESLRGMEERLQGNHMDRLRQRMAKSMETTNLHQETLRVLKAVNSAMATAAAPILERAGVVLPTRLAPGQTPS